MLGTLAGRERNDPVVVVSGDRDLLQLVRDDPVAVRVLYLGRGLAKATKFGPARGRRNLRRARRPRRPGVRRAGAAARRSVRRAARRARRRREDGGHAAGAARLAGAHPRRRPRPEIEDVQGVSDEAARRHRLHRGRRTGGQGSHRLPTSNFSTPSDTLPLAAEHPRKVAKLAEAVRRHVVDRPAAEGARRAAATG